MKQKLMILASVLTLALSAAPEASAQWVQTNGPYGGTALSLAGTGAKLFAGFDGGIFHSTNNAASWSSVSTGLTGSNVTSIFVDGDTIYAGTSGTGGTVGVFRSTDDGLSWKPASSGLLTGEYDPNVFTTAGENLLVGNRYGIYLLNHNTLRWAQVDSLSASAFTMMGTSLFAGEFDVSVSTNLGATWRVVDSNLVGPPWSDTYALTSIGTKLLAGTNNGVFLSHDSGVTWIAVDSGLIHHAVSFATINRVVFCATDSGVVSSIDSGKTWENAGLSGFDVHVLLGDSSRMFAGTNAGIFLSTDSGINWIPVDSGFIAYPINSLSSLGTEIFAGSWGSVGDDGGVFLTTDSGNMWVAPNTSLSNGSILTIEVDSSNLLAGTDENGAYVSSNQGSSWIEIDSGMSRGTASYSDVFHREGDILLRGTRYGVFRSTNNGAIWNMADTGLSLIDDLIVSSFASIGSEIFAAGNSGYNGGDVYVSTDSGLSWNPSGNGIPDTAGGLGPDYHTDIQSLAVIGNTLFAGVFVNGGNCGLFVSTDKGMTWTERNSGLTDTSVRALLVSGTNLFAATEGGVFLTTNSGLNWQNVSEGLSSPIVYSLTVSGSTLYAGTYYSGVWRRPLSDFGISAVSPTESNHNSFTAFPNPLTQSTTINFTSHESGAAEITVVNLLGAEVARIYSGELNAGEHSFVWVRPTGLPPGTYWCKIRMNGMADQIPIVIQR